MLFQHPFEHLLEKSRGEIRFYEGGKNKGIFINYILWKTRKFSKIVGLVASQIFWGGLTSYFFGFRNDYPLLEQGKVILTHPWAHRRSQISFYKVQLHFIKLERFRGYFFYLSLGEGKIFQINRFSAFTMFYDDKMRCFGF